MSIWFFAMFIFVGAIFYIGWRIQQTFISPRHRNVYWLIFLLLSSSFLLAERMEMGAASWITEGLAWVGSYAAAVIFYAFWLLLLIDLVRLLDRWLGFIPLGIKKIPGKVGLVVVCLIIGLMVYGTWNAWHPMVNKYDISINKTVPGTKELHAVVVSDVHLGAFVTKNRLQHMVNMINRQNPDIVFFAGDIIDGNTEPYVKNNMGAVLRELKPRLGIYMCMGNHDGHGSAAPYLEAAGVKVLRDQYQLIDGRFYIVGRDNMGFHGGDHVRKKLYDVIAGINPKLPIIVLDHNPSTLEEAEDNGVDLQLSGHTHQGQMFPNNFITGNMYEVDHGLLRKGDLQVIVSTGFGTWGPPIRVGNKPEIVDLTIRLK
ncbi:MAG: metallophosphoesterase [Acidobacteriota bacterium]